MRPKSKGLVLSLFPGMDLFGEAFVREGFTVVRGPDLLWGGDVRDFHPPAGVFEGVIGGPPCQRFNLLVQARGVAYAETRLDLIPEFIRCIKEAKPRWLVMENVPTVSKYTYIPPEWHKVVLRDWDCGGLTYRRRIFFTWPFQIETLPRREGKPSLSVPAVTCKTIHPEGKGYLPWDLPLDEYARLQGADGMIDEIKKTANRHHIVHLLGNGVPLAMGSYVARSIPLISGMRS